MARIFAAGIPTRRGVMASHLEPLYAGTGFDLPNTEEAPAQGLQLPLHPGLSDEGVERVCQALLRPGLRAAPPTAVPGLDEDQRGSLLFVV